MDPFILGGLIGGIGSLGSSILGNTVGYNQSKQLMDYQYQLQQQAIDKANAYNHPAQQMKRLAEAQLSPNLVYGNGVDGNQASPAQVSAVNRTAKIDNPLQDMAQNLVARKQMELEQIRLRNESFESRERQFNLRAKTLGQMLENSYMDKTMKTRIEHAGQKLANDVERQSILAEQKNNLLIQRDVLVEQAHNIAAKTKLTDEQALTQVVYRKSLEAGINLKYAQAKQVAHMLPYIDAGTDLRSQEYEQKGLEFEATDELNKWLSEHPNVELTVDIAKEVLGAIGGTKSGRHRTRRGKKK